MGLAGVKSAHVSGVDFSIVWHSVGQLWLSFPCRDAGISHKGIVSPASAVSGCGRALTTPGVLDSASICLCVSNAVCVPARRRVHCLHVVMTTALARTCRPTDVPRQRRSSASATYKRPFNHFIFSSFLYSLYHQFTAIISIA